MDQYVHQAKIRRIVNREWPEPSASQDPPSPPTTIGTDGCPQQNGVADVPLRPVMRNRPIFEYSSKHDARFDAANLFFETVTKKGIPTWMAYILAFDFVAKFESDLNLQRVEWRSDVYEAVKTKFVDQVSRRINEYMHGVRANENLIPDFPSDVMNFEYSLASAIGSRRTMEDRFVALPSLSLIEPERTKGREKDSLFAVFDGHNGPFSAMYAAAHLAESFLDEEEKNSEDTLDYCVRSYYRTNSRLRQRSVHDGVKSGTTAAITFIRDNTIYMLWAGDSAIMLMKKDGVVTQSVKHVPSDELELKRITAANGFVSNGRVNNILNISRSMGEMMAEDLVIPDPDTKIHPIGEDDYALILCSDGITDGLNEKDIYRLLKSHAKSGADYGQAADVLRKTAEDSSGDNKTALVVYLKPYSQFCQVFSEE
ncbi:unnamed protein product [Bursaphelenchus xylophilus]|uniref:(pine wood nematode) hypothetical protein n=1 Tax=Bursaphelenchus xylophilus TaxID=6326 RepID=A0A1I7SQK7_BURXY|nr:sex determination protein [Bursaphelenchus xylophilus]CAD5222383.1 unnamed protein product [Bursaphelenchus xylophilus]CAG9110043.1 unnamed protein product [Bursaphelenchus xylophilus]